MWIEKMQSVFHMSNFQLNFSSWLGSSSLLKNNIFATKHFSLVYVVNFHYSSNSTETFQRVLENFFLFISSIQ